MKFVCAGLCLIAMPAVWAADFPTEGNYSITTCFTRTRTRIDFSPTQAAWSYADTGTTVTEPKGGPFDDNTVRCVGFGASLDAKTHGGSVCETVDKDGDKRVTRFWYDDKGVPQRDLIAATGKYEGMTMTGAVRVVKEADPKAEHPEFCTLNTGTYKMKARG